MILMSCFWNSAPVPERSSSQRIQAKGIYPGADVVRGPHWAAEYKEQDGKNMFWYDQTSCITYSADGDE